MKKQVLWEMNGKNWGKYSSITHNCYGEGEAYYIGCYTEKEAVKQILQKAAEAAGKERQLTDHEFVWPVVVRKGKNVCGDTLRYVLHYSENDTEIVNPWGEVTDLLTGKKYGIDDKITLSDWDVKILVDDNKNE